MVDPSREAGSGASRRALGEAFARAAPAALVVAGARAAMVAPRFDLEPLRLDALGTAVVARHLVLGFGIAAPAFLALAAAAKVLRESGRKSLWVAPVALALVLGALLASCRWPRLALYAPGLETTAGRLANGLAACAALVAGVFLAPAVRWPRRWPARRLLAGCSLAAVLAAGVLGYGPRGDAGRWPGRPNVVVISVDTLRADRLGCYGYAPPTSPEIDRFAAQSRIFTRAYSNSTWTLASHMTMLTSLRTSSHGVNVNRALGLGSRTLAMALRDGGYDTLGLVDDVVWLAPRYGFDRGFDIYLRSGGPAPTKVRYALELLDEVRDRPFFLFVHFYDVHSDFDQLPYESAPADRDRFAGWYRGPFEGCDDEGRCASELLRGVASGDFTLEDDELRFVSDLYDAGIRTLDRHVGTLLRGMEQRGLFENSVVVLTADHGEQFLEHGSVLHGEHYEECVRVPLLIRTPQTQGGTSDTLAGLVDVMPTVLELAGLDSPGMEGESLVPWLADRPEQSETPGRDVIFSETTRRLLSLRTRDWSVVRGPERWSIYHVAADPREERDLADDPPEELPVLMGLVQQEQRRIAKRAKATGADSPAASLSADERALLRKLGYTGDEGD